MKKHLGSTVALILGALTFVAGITQQQGSLLIAGPIIFVGAFAYRSAKKRILGEVKNSLLRKILEAVAVIVIIMAVLLQNDLARLIATDPVPNLIIPLWVIIAYIIVVLRRPKVINEIEDVNKHD
jgi:hypothetical protein